MRGISGRSGAIETYSRGRRGREEAPPLDMGRLRMLRYAKGALKTRRELTSTRGASPAMRGKAQKMTNAVAVPLGGRWAAHSPARRREQTAQRGCERPSKPSRSPAEARASTSLVSSPTRRKRGSARHIPRASGPKRCPNFTFGDTLEEYARRFPHRRFPQPKRPESNGNARRFPQPAARPARDQQQRGSLRKDPAPSAAGIF